MHIISKLICTAKMSTVHQQSVLPTNQHMQSLHKGPFTLIINWFNWKDKSLLVVAKICINPHHLYDPRLYNPTIIQHFIPYHLFLPISFIFNSNYTTRFTNHNPFPLYTHKAINAIIHHINTTIPFITSAKNSPLPS